MNIAIPKGGGNFYLLTNENLKVGDSVFPIVSGYRTNGTFYVVSIYTEIDFRTLACTGFPTEPHTVREFYYEDKLLFIRTDKGYSPAEVYFKLIEPKSSTEVCSAKADPKSTIESESKWLTMDTAPKDGLVLLAYIDKQIADDYVDFGCGLWAPNYGCPGWRCGGTFVDPIAWMPIPPFQIKEPK